MKHLVTLLLFIVFTTGSLMANPDGRDLLSNETQNNTTASQQQETQTKTSALELEALETDEATANAAEAEVTTPASIFQNMSDKEMRKMERKAKRAKKFINGSAKSGKKAGFFARVAAKLKMAIMKKMMLEKNILAIILMLVIPLVASLGIHRVIMGGRGILILLYFITCGGIFGILPLIDFIMLIIDPDRYVNNDKFIAL